MISEDGNNEGRGAEMVNEIIKRVRSKRFLGVGLPSDIRDFIVSVGVVCASVVSVSIVVVGVVPVVGVVFFLLLLLLLLLFLLLLLLYVFLSCFSKIN